MANAFIFTGRMASSPVLTRPNGTSVCKFTLIRNEYAGKDDSGAKRPERKVALQFVAFEGKAEAIAEHVMEGDQIEITARIENNNYTDKDNIEHYGFNFVLQDFEFGAPGARKREQLASKAG